MPDYEYKKFLEDAVYCQPKGSCVYIIDVDSYYKIGIAKDFKKRVKALQTGCYKIIELLAFYETDKPHKLEQLLHDELREYQTIGEWFDCGQQKILDIIEKYEFSQCKLLGVQTSRILLNELGKGTNKN
jgi:hypothetical protein